MQNLQELTETGTYSEYVPDAKQPVRDFLESLGLSEDGLFGVLVNGKRADLDDFVTESDKVVVIPHLKGG